MKPVFEEKNEVLSVKEDIYYYYKNSSIQACFNLSKAILRIKVLASVFKDPNFIQVCFATVDIICWSNLIKYTCSIEGSNSVTVVMKAENLSLTDTVDYISKLYEGFSDTILECKGKIKSFRTRENEDIRVYIYAMEQWDYRNLVWSFNMQGYFGPEHEEVKHTRVVKLKEYKSVV
ncbi:uncharacterized protein FOMMEDRAFT_90136 [Fomitiporia mediterranea MF3/22]|uniref:uncharacterized protein n=1 Tax=Fomitiporia mediterranea (strain MF3/22) TaxID=694068 RepID=UPI0004408F11|nr:uncharacterized protein FOMMEDRAFT_90136 [Fomitiporia mediterranea MF3/22]EJD00856.1 hypothetical protein FOMMEDRAFT_90136 [Fomitiporia mediterranea MF3/22]